MGFVPYSSKRMDPSARKIGERSPLLGPTTTGNNDEEAARRLPHTRTFDPRRASSASFDIEDDENPHPTPRQRRSSSHLLSRATSSARLSAISVTTRLAQQESLGLMLLLIAAFFSSCMALSYTLLSRLTATLPHPVTALQVIFARMGMTYIACLAALFIKGDPHPFLGPRGVRRLLCARGVIGFGGIFGFLSSLRYLPLADAQVINMGLIPIMTGVFCAVFLGETFKRKEMGAGVASLVGVVLIARPKAIFGTAAASIPASEAAAAATPPSDVDESQRLFAIGLALFGVVAGAGAFTIIRAIGTRASPLHSVSFFALYSTLVSPLLAWLQGEVWELPAGNESGDGMASKRTEAAVLLGCTTVFGLCAQLLLTKGLQLCKGGKATTTAYTQAIWSCLFQLVFLHEPVSVVRRAVENVIGADILALDATRLPRCRPLAVPSS